MDATEKIKEMMKQRGWSAYKLAKKSGLSETTIANLIRRNTVPSIPTVEAICNGFGISLSQFFSDGETIEVSSEYKPLIDCWSALSPEQREAALKLLQVIILFHF